MTESAGMEAFRSIMRWLRSPEAQSQILLILMEFAVHQNVDVAQQLTRDVPVAQFSGQNIFFIVIAGVAPYRLFPDTPRVPAASVPTGRADFPVQRVRRPTGRDRECTMASDGREFDPPSLG